MFVDGRTVYFIFPTNVVKYSIDQNSFQTVKTSLDILSMKVFKGQSIYWRTKVKENDPKRYF